MSDPAPAEAGDAAWERFVAGLDPVLLERERFGDVDPAEEFTSLESRRERDRHAVVVALVRSLNAGEITAAEYRDAIADLNNPHTHHGDRS